MANSVREQIHKIQQVYKSGDRVQATAMMRPIIQRYPSNTKLWLMLARITPNDDDAILALKNVLKLDPCNAQAQEILIKLGDEETISSAAAERGQDIYTKSLGTPGRRTSGGITRQQITCEACGAHLSLAEGQRITECSFCGATHFIEMPAAQQQAVDINTLESGYIVPFALKPQACAEITAKWLGSSWMTPASLKDSAKVSSFTPVYLPFWAFDADIRGQWEAELGYDRTETYYEDGERKTRTVTDWRYGNGIIHTNIRRLKVPATTNLSEVLVDRVDDYNLNKMRDYNAQYTQKIVLQVQDVPAHQAYDRARVLMEQQVERDIRDKVSQKIRNIRLSADFRNEDHCAIKLPVYLSVYKFKDKTYQLVINGQTGNISGQRPVDWLIVSVVCAAIIIPAIILTMLHFSVDVAAGAETSRFIVMAGIAGLIGIIADALILMTAFSYDDT